MRTYDNLPPEDHDLAGHLRRKYGRRQVAVVDGFAVWDSLATGNLYLLHSLDVVDAGSGKMLGHTGVSRFGNVKIHPSCSCKRSAEDAISARRAAGTRAERA